MTEIRNVDIYDFLGRHAHDLCTPDKFPIPNDVFPNSWIGGVPVLGQLRYELWTHCFVSRLPTEKSVFWYTHDFPDNSAPVSLLPTEDMPEECKPDDRHILYPSVLAEAKRHGIKLPQCKIFQKGDGQLMVATDDSPIFVSNGQTTDRYYQPQSLIKVGRNTPITIEVPQGDGRLPIFTLFFVDRSFNSTGKILPFPYIALRIDEQFLNLLTQPIGRNPVLSLELVRSK